MLCHICAGVMLSFMSIPLEKIAEVALSLPSDARALLADRLVESLDPLTDETVRQAWATESLRRRDDVRAGKVVTISETDVARRVRALLK
jgi:putative addiction module component (TIGR02574 family)